MNSLSFKKKKEKRLNGETQSLLRNNKKLGPFPKPIFSWDSLIPVSRWRSSIQEISPWGIRWWETGKGERKKLHPQAFHASKRELYLSVPSSRSSVLSTNQCVQTDRNPWRMRDDPQDLQNGGNKHGFSHPQGKDGYLGNYRTINHPNLKENTVLNHTPHEKPSPTVPHAQYRFLVD